MSQPQLLKKVIVTLEQSGIEYMLTGSVVSSLQGEPRSTHDIDIVVVIEPGKISNLTAAFPPPDYYLDAESIRESLNRQDMFNLIDVRAGDKVDFWILSDESFDSVRFARKQQVEFAGVKMNVSSPEDTILAKLRWAKLSGGSEKQFGDALHVYEVQYHYLDLEYLTTWIERLDLGVLWERLISKAVID
jgi:hypothetical protein